MTDKPINVLWIMTDQQRADSLGCMGNGAARTPNIDSIAEQGLLFSNAYCQCPASMASRAAALTGRYPSAIPVRGMGLLPPDEVTTPEMFQRNGYSTGCFGKLHFTPQLYTREVLGSDKPILDVGAYAKDAQIECVPDDPFKKNYGFQAHVGCDDTLQGEHRRWLEKVKPELLAAEKQTVEGGPGDLYVSPYPPGYHQSTFIAKNAADYIRKQADGGKPWFTFCSFIAPHHPFEAPEQHINRFSPEMFDIPAQSNDSEKMSIPETVREAWEEMEGWTDTVKRKIMQHYYASVSLIDDGVGLLLKTLAEAGELEKTIIVYTSDHGEFLCNRGLLRKPSIHYDDTLNVPLIISLPGGGGGKRVNGLIELTDLHPTVLGLAGLDINPGVQGIDWSGPIKNNAATGKKSIYAENYDDPFDKDQCMIVSGGPYGAVQTLRTEQWKLNIYPTAGREYGQLFDLENDPGETVNLYRDPDYSNEREEMLWELSSRRFGQADPLPHILSQW